MVEIPKKFTIDRSKWRCGEGADELGNGGEQAGIGDTLLLNEEGFMCCLGQISEQCGVPTEALNGHPSPRGLEGHEKVFDGFLLAGFEAEGGPIATELCAEAMSINDDMDLDLETREKYLTNLFAEHGYELEFTGEYKNVG